LRPLRSLENVELELVCSTPLVRDTIPWSHEMLVNKQLNGINTAKRSYEGAAEMAEQKHYLLVPASLAPGRFLAAQAGPGSAMRDERTLPTLRPKGQLSPTEGWDCVSHQLPARGDSHCARAPHDKSSHRGRTIQ
jgi:hypothetical protein